MLKLPLNPGDLVCFPLYLMRTTNTGFGTLTYSVFIQSYTDTDVDTRNQFSENPLPLNLIYSVAFYYFL